MCEILETVRVVAFLCLSIYFAKDRKPVFGSIFLDAVGDAILCFPYNICVIKSNGDGLVKPFF
jgi:hypothetical protein